MTETPSTGQWKRSERVLSYSEIASLSEKAQGLSELMHIYNSSKGTESLSAKTLDIIFSRWLSDTDRAKLSTQEVVTILGVTFGNFLCDRLFMQWAEISDDDGTTYAVRHEETEVYCFPFESIKKRVVSSEVGFFAAIEDVVRQKIEDPTSRIREQS